MKHDDPGDALGGTLTLRALATLEALVFVFVAAGIALCPSAWWVSALGVAFHLGLLPIVSALPARAAAKAMGYVWIGIDVLASVLTINGIDPHLAMAVRLGGHVAAATWIGTASLGASKPRIRSFGILAALALGGHSLVAPWVSSPPVLLIAAGLLTIAWLLSLALYDGFELLPVQWTSR